MVDSEQKQFVSTIQDRVRKAHGTVGEKVGKINDNATAALNDAITIVDERIESASEFTSELSDDAIEVLYTVIDVAEKYITENDLDISVSKHHIHIEGDADGLRKIEADLRQVFQNKDIYVEFDSDRGINIEYDSEDGTAN